MAVYFPKDIDWESGAFTNLGSRENLDQWITRASVVWTCDTFENNFWIKYKFWKYLKESWNFSPDEHFFCQKISEKSSGKKDII